MSRNLDSDASFGVWRSFFWPIHSFELKRFLPMFVIMVLICFNASTLRSLKDSIVIPSSGAEVIPFIKMWVLLPMAILMTVVFTKLSNVYSQERVFYIMVSLFLAFFALFGFVLYPLRESIHPHETAKYLSEFYPGFKWFIVLCENWSFTLFYTISELWSTIILQVIFWGFANEVTRVQEARRFYSMFAIGSNFAAVLAGLCAVIFISSSGAIELDLKSLTDEIALSEAVWEQKLSAILSLVICCGLVVMGLFRWINKNVLTDPRFDDLHRIKRSTRVKGKLSLRESFNYLKNSKYLLCIAVLVVSYNLSINLVEIVWKDQVKQLFPAKADFMTFMSFLTLCMGIVSTSTAFFMSHIISKWGWTFTALITPITMMITSVAFFSFFFFREAMGPIVISLLGTTPLAIAVYIGFAQNCFSKAAKYSVFDATKEMAFIPLEHNVKLKGKAAIDGVGSRLGKSGGSLIHTGLLMIFYSLSASSLYVAFVLLSVIAVWIVAAKSLGRQFDELTSEEPFYEVWEEPVTVSVVLQETKTTG